jgi:YbbR domain-containing protein
VQIRKTGTAQGVEPLEISMEPMEISMRLDHKISKYIPVTANLSGTVESGYELVSYTLNPTQVVVEGPLSVLGDISELNTDFIDLEGRSEDFSATVNILNREPLIVIRGNGQAEFRGFVRKPVPVRNFDEVPIIIKNLNGNFEAELETDVGSVRLEGSQNQLDLFVPPPDFLSIDCSSIAAGGTYTLPVVLNVPQGLNPVRREPQDAVFSVRKKGGTF